jgi:hypothetical protein
VRKGREEGGGRRDKEVRTGREGKEVYLRHLSAIGTE